MSQVLGVKRKVIRNRGKRARIGSHGFKVKKNTYVYVAKEASSKPAPKAEVVEALQNHFNSSKSIRKMVKHVKRIKIMYSYRSKWAGLWHSEKQQFTYIDCDRMSPANAVEVMIHEIDGHAFWDWAKEWRNEEWNAFNKLANALPSVNDYVATYEKNKSDYRNDTIYENEQHSAVTELMVFGSSYHKQLINKEDLDKLKKAWEELHY